MKTFHIFSNIHISKEVMNVKKGDWVFLENDISYKRWQFYFRLNHINEEHLEIKYITREEFFSLKIDKSNIIIVGNPPYNDTNNGNIPIYPKFVEKSMEIANKVYLIIPSAFATSDERHGNKVRELVGNEQTKRIEFLPKDTFDNVDVETLYFIWERNSKNDTLIVNGKQGYKTTEYSYIWKDVQLKRILDKCGTSNSKESWIKFHRMENSLMDGKEVETVTTINKDVLTMTKTNMVDRYIDHHRVVTSFLPNSPNHLDVSYSINPGVAVKDGYTVSICKTSEEANNLVEYLKSKLVLCIFNKTKTSRTLRTPQLKFVPKIDLRKRWSDEDLYNHFKLSRDEIEYIEEAIK